MQLTVQGKQMDVGDALREHITEKLGDVNHKYFNHATDATVTMSKEGHSHAMIRAHIHIRVGKNIMVIADAVENDPYAAFDGAAERVAKQLRRYKKRLRDHHHYIEGSAAKDITVRDYVLAHDPEIEEDEEPKHEPVIVAEMSKDIQMMSVSDAVMRMNLAGETVMLFRNAKHGGVNVVYKRSDGNIGWVDPGEGMVQSENQMKSA
jgi:ribosomal subunit interface protein